MTKIVEIIFVLLSISATLFGAAFVVATFFSWSKIRGNVRIAIREHTESEIKKIKEELYKTNRVYAEYLLLIQNISDPMAFETEVEKLIKLYPQLWNVWVYAAVKYLKPLMRHQVQYWSRLEPDRLQRDHIAKALHLLDKAKLSQKTHDLSEVALWNGVAYALLREPMASMNNLRNVTNPYDLRKMFRWLDLFWGMFPLPDEENLSNVAKIFNLEDLLLSSENVRNLIRKNNVTSALSGFSPGVWFLGTERITSNPCSVGIIPRSQGDESSGPWRIDYQIYHVSDNGMVRNSEDVESLNQAVDFLSKKFVGLVLAPSELLSRWMDERNIRQQPARFT